MPRTPPKRPASNTTLSRGAAWPCSGWDDADALLVQSSCAKTKVAKSTSRVSSSSRSSVDTPGLKDVVQGSTCAMSSSPRVRACSSFFCCPDEPRKMRGLSIRFSDIRSGGGRPLTASSNDAQQKTPCQGQALSVLEGSLLPVMGRCQFLPIMNGKDDWTEVQSS